MNKINIFYLNSNNYFPWDKWTKPSKHNSISLTVKTQKDPVLISYIFYVMDFYL